MEVITIGGARFSSGFRICETGGEIFEFSELQAAAIGVIAEAHQAGVAAVHGKTILDRIAKQGFFPNRVDEVFRTHGRRHPAWETLIVRAGRNSYRIKNFPGPQKGHNRATVSKSI